MQCDMLTDIVQITVEHPAAKSMIEIARTQDEEVGDGTTSVIILGNTMLLTRVRMMPSILLGLVDTNTQHRYQYIVNTVHSDTLHSFFNIYTLYTMSSKKSLQSS